MRFLWRHRSLKNDANIDVYNPRSLSSPALGNAQTEEAAPAEATPTEEATPAAVEEAPTEEDTPAETEEVPADEAARPSPRNSCRRGRARDKASSTRLLRLRKPL